MQKTIKSKEYLQEFQDGNKQEIIQHTKKNYLEKRKYDNLSCNEYI